MLSRAGFRDDALLVHASREQHLAERVVDLVRACVQEIFTLEIDGGATAVVRSGVRREREAWAGPRSFAKDPSAQIGTIDRLCSRGKPQSTPRSGAIRSPAQTGRHTFPVTKRIRSGIEEDISSLQANFSCNGGATGYSIATGVL